MRIREIFAKDIMPIRFLHVSELSDVVVIAGPNGVGKTRFINWLISFIQGLPSKETQYICFEATSAEERKLWGTDILDTRKPADVAKLRPVLQRKRQRGQNTSSLLHFESNRAITQIKPYAFTFDSFDPFTEEVDWKIGYGSLSGRFQDTINSMFRKIQSRKDSISARADALFKNTENSGKQAGADDGGQKITLLASDFPDPLIPFKQAFTQLLAPKYLIDPNIRDQKLYFADGTEKREITALSSGEREVVNIVFDFLLRNPQDCVVLFDEPELHLHPELSYKLLQTLKTFGSRNQFIFCTHSADIISASLDNSVIFITPPKPQSENQAIVVREEDQTHQALKLIGQSIGIVSLGRRVVLIEGNTGSLDKQTYGTILRDRYPNLALAPSGGKDQVQSFGATIERVLQNTVWGVDFFMLCDRDAISRDSDIAKYEAAANGRLKFLKRYHLENYFLDEDIIAEMFSAWEPANSWLISRDQICERLRLIAKSSVAYVAGLILSREFRERVGNLDIMPSDCFGKTAIELTALIANRAKEERQRIMATVSEEDILRRTKETIDDLETSLSDGAERWKTLFPGRIVLKTFCSGANAKFDFGRFKLGYLKVAESRTVSPFAEIETIFESFSNYESHSAQ